MLKESEQGSSMVQLSMLRIAKLASLRFKYKGKEIEAQLCIWAWTINPTTIKLNHIHYSLSCERTSSHNSTHRALHGEHGELAQTPK